MQNYSIPHSALSASSAGSDKKATDARLKRSGAWIANYKAGQWLQVELDSVTNITGIATQGYLSSSYNRWTKQYQLYSSCDGEYWQPYKKVREHSTFFPDFPCSSQQSTYQK